MRVLDNLLCGKRIKQDLPGENLISEISSFLSLNPTIFSSESESKMRNPPSF